MRRYGLVGRNISYSFSGKYFADKFSNENIEDAVYEIFDLKSINEIQYLIESDELAGFNVTIPFKREIIPFLDELDETVEKTGAVNCVKILKGKRIGYNTDTYGFEESFKPLILPNHKKALILGNGGAAQAVKYVLDKLKIEYLTVSRKGKFTYADINKDIICEYSVIINCTPVGTFPNIEEKPDIPYEFLTSKHLLYDLVYNPGTTKFMELGRQKGAIVKNGYEMLILQAEKSWEIWS